MKLPIALSALMIVRDLAEEEYYNKYQHYKGNDPNILAEIPMLERFINNSIFEPSFWETMYQECSLNKVLANGSLMNFAEALYYYLVLIIEKKASEDKYKKYYDILQILRFLKIKCTWNEMTEYKKDYLWLSEIERISIQDKSPSEWEYVKGEDIRGEDIATAIFEKLYHFKYKFSKRYDGAISDFLDLLSSQDFLEVSGEIRINPIDFTYFVDVIRSCERCLNAKIKGNPDDRVIALDYFSKSSKLVHLELRFLQRFAYYSMVGFTRTETSSDEKAHRVGVSFDERLNFDRFFKKCPEFHTNKITRIDLFEVG